jgi:hypothetical protein
MDNAPFRLVKNSSKSDFFNWKMLLIISGIVIVFFIFVYPALKKEHMNFDFNYISNIAKENAVKAVDEIKNLTKQTKQTMTNLLPNNAENMADIEKATKMTVTGDLTDETSNENLSKVDTMYCSKSCCSPQWGMENQKDERVMPNDLGSKFYPTNYMCNGENVGDHGNGCVCMTKDGFDELGFRGGNNS